MVYKLLNYQQTEYFAKLSCLKTCCRSVVYPIIGWHKTVPVLLSLTFADVERFSSKSARATQRGYQFFILQYIHDVVFQTKDDKIFIKARCKRSQKKRQEHHYVNACIDSMSDRPRPILDTECSCAAGKRKSVGCAHSVGLLYTVANYKKLNLATVPDVIATTSLPQQWGIPRTDNLTPQPVMDITYKKAKVSASETEISCTLYNTKNKSSSSHDELQSLQTLHEQIVSMESTRSLPIAHLLSLPSNPVWLDTRCGKVLQGSTLAHQLAPVEDGYKVYTNIGFVSAKTSSKLTTSKYPLLPLFRKDNITCTSRVLEDLTCDLGPLHTAVLDKLVVDQNVSSEIEKQTVLQSESSRWHQERHYCVTSSKFGDIMLRKSDPSASFMRSFNADISSKIPSIHHGLTHEASAVAKYSTYLQNIGHHTLIEHVGFTIHPDYFWLGASPDRKVIDTAEKDPYGIIEVKCPFSHKDKLLEDACHDPSFFMFLGDDGKPKLNHKYYFQVQGQLAITGAPWADFVVYTFKSMSVERICFDSVCWSKMLMQLNEFYFKSYLPFLVANEI